VAGWGWSARGASGPGPSHAIKVRIGPVRSGSGVQRTHACVAARIGDGRAAGQTGEPPDRRESRRTDGTTGEPPDRPQTRDGRAAGHGTV
jgi:hypothetical protein